MHIVDSLVLMQRCWRMQIIGRL